MASCEHHFKAVSMSPSKPTAIPDSPLVSGNKSALQEAPASEDAASALAVRTAETTTKESRIPSAINTPPTARPSNPSVAARPADRPNPSVFDRDPFFNDPFFTDPFGSGSIFNHMNNMNNMMFDGFFGARRPAPRQARPSQDYGSNTPAPRGGITGTQLPLCDICNNQLTMEGGITCITCTDGKQFGCSTCALTLACLRQKHEVYKIEFRGN